MFSVRRGKSRYAIQTFVWRLGNVTGKATQAKLQPEKVKNVVICYMFKIAVLGYNAHFRLLALIFVFMTCLTSIKAQGLCDSTLVVCDSVTVDSVVFTSFPQTGDRVHFFMTSNYDYLNGPIFTICPLDSGIEFVSDDYVFSGIVGPITFIAFYEFLDFHVVGDSLQGYLVLDNKNNLRQNCALFFQVAIDPGASNTSEVHQLDGITVFPNPTKYELTVDLAGNTLTGNEMQLFDLMGGRQDITYTATSVDLSSIASGVYYLRLEVKDDRVVTKRVVVR